MKFIITLIILAIFVSGAWCQDYNVSLIPEKLRTGANVVKRFEENTFEVSDIDRAKLKAHYVYTVLNKDGGDKLNFAMMTNKYTSLSDFEMRCYDPFGKEMAKYKRKDLIKQARYAEVVAEGMFNYLHTGVSAYPVTVDVSYEISYSGTLFYPPYEIQGIDEGVEQSSLTVKIPKELGIRFKEQNITLSPTMTDDGKNQIYKWSVSNLEPFKYEPGSVNEFNYCPAIVFAPNKFRIYNTNGDMSTWKSFGQWEADLIKDIDILPDERKAFFTDMVKDAKTDKEKIAIVYRYLQNNFRYVSIQLGIGGYQPFPAKFTDDKKYGDCKGLSFYMYSVLKSLGIKSYVALINAAYDMPPVDPLFPMNNFNHMILCVPQGKDSIWLECTSKTIEFNFLGSTTENRNALLITENGGVLVPTPRSNPANNTMRTKTYIDLKEDGSGKTTSKIQTKGIYNQMLIEMETSRQEDQKELIVNYFGFKQPDNFAVTKRNSEDENTEITLNIEKIPQFTAGTKMFLNPRIYPLLSGSVPASDNRKHDYYFRTCFDKTDTTIYHLPAGYVVDVLPKKLEKHSALASYNTNYEYDKEKNELVVSARFILNQNIIPSVKFAEVKSFFDQVLSDDAQKLVIKKN